MKNTLRSRNYLKIKRTIQGCVNYKQLQIALTMIANHRNIKESDLLLEIYNEKNKELNPDYYEKEILNIHHKKLSP